MRLLAFEEKNFKIERFRRNEASQHAWNSVSERTIKNCFKKVNFAQPEDNLKKQETEETSDREIVEIWEKLKAGGLIPDSYGLHDHSTSDKRLIIRETITESSVLSELIADEDGEKKIKIFLLKTFNLLSYF